MRPPSKKRLKRLLAGKQNVADTFLREGTIVRPVTPDDIATGYSDGGDVICEPSDEAARAAYRSWMEHLNREILRMQKGLDEAKQVRQSDIVKRRENRRTPPVD